MANTVHCHSKVFKYFRISDSIYFDRKISNNGQFMSIPTYRYEKKWHKDLQKSMCWISSGSLVGKGMDSSRVSFKIEKSGQSFLPESVLDKSLTTSFLLPRRLDSRTLLFLVVDCWIDLPRFLVFLFNTLDLVILSLLFPVSPSWLLLSSWTSSSNTSSSFNFSIINAWAISLIMSL